MTPRRLGWLVVFVLLTSAGWLAAQQAGSMPQWPGITSRDTWPNGCVDCHKITAAGRDLRLSTTLRRWATQGTDPSIVAVARSVFPRATTLQGRHPDVVNIITTGAIPIPMQCISCHKSQGRPIGPVVHLIHLSVKPKIPASASLSERSGGYCTSCHLLNLSTGAMTIKGGSEAR